MRFARWIKTVLSLVILLASLSIYPAKSNAFGVDRLFQDPVNPNIFYFVAMVYFDVWSYDRPDKTNRKNWVDGIMPGDTRYIDGFEYDFTFNKNRKVKSVEAEKFIFNGQYSREIFEKSRSGSTYDMEYYQNATSSNYNVKYITSGVPGIGTNSIVAPIYISDGKLDAIRKPIDRVEEERNNGQVLGKETEAWRYFFPTKIIIELEPEEGKSVVKHYTTNGVSLDGTGPFKDKEEKLLKDKPYNYTHTPGNADYVYKGYKKSTTAPPSGGSILNGDPPGFTYDGSFPNYYVYFYYEPDGPPPPTGGCSLPTPGQAITGGTQDPRATGEILADHGSNGGYRFDAVQGIPTSEYLYGNTVGLNYLFKNKFVEMSGTCTFQVPVKQEIVLKWTEVTKGTDDKGKPTETREPKEDTVTLSETVAVERKYSYWVIDNLEVNKLDKAEMSNYALPGGKITINPSEYTPPSYSASQKAGIEKPKVDPPNPAPITKTGGTTRPDPPKVDLKAIAEKAVGKVKVNNDTLIFNGATIMNGGKYDEKGPPPGSIPMPTMIGKNVLNKDSQLIDSSKLNRQSAPSSGTIYYDLMSGNIKGGNAISAPIAGINDVTVHTPTVIYSGVSDDKDHNQKTKPNMARSALILDRPFTIVMPTKGQHTSKPGYGNRDYQKYIKQKEVWFPFDVKTSTGTFIPKKTWYSIPVSAQTFDFFLPVWVDEGDYSVLFRSFAENAPSSGFSTQVNANLNLANHVATDTVDVEVIGRVYDFRVTDVEDYLWEKVFRKEKGSKEHTGNYYWVGPNGIDGAARGNTTPFVLPILKGSNPLQAHANVVVKQGYKFKFDLKTKGNMYDRMDGIRITPTFFFVDSKGRNRQEVDLYYHSKDKYFVKVGSKDDKFKLEMALDERLRNVPESEISSTAGTLYDLGLTQGTFGDRATYIKRYLQIAQRKTFIGGFNGIALTNPIRTFFGPVNVPNGVSVPRAHAAEQKWYGEYSVPTKSYIVPKGFNIFQQGSFNDKAPFFLKDGFLIVNFNIETIRDGDQNNPHLQYIYAPLTNQWKREGFRYNARDPYGVTFQLKDGDVMFYDGNKSMLDDFTSSGIM